MILGGNMRYKALQELGYKEIPDEWVKKDNELTKEQKQEFIVKDNIGFGEWNYDLLSADFDMEELAEWGLDDIDLGIDDETISESSRGGSYNDDFDKEIEPFKLAYRLEAACFTDHKKCIELYAGRGALTYWYKRIFDNVITSDKQSFDGIEQNYMMTAENFIKNELEKHMDFDYIDFDDEGCPNEAIQLFFKQIARKKTTPFIIAVTDGCGLAIKCRGKLNFHKFYLQGDNNVRQCTSVDYDNFQFLVRKFMATVCEQHGFLYQELSCYRKDSGNAVYLTGIVSLAI
jgi:hypothetical protein